MTARYLLDTDIIIFLRGRRSPADLRTRFARLAVGEAVMSVVSFGELRYGAEKGADASAARRDLDSLRASIPVLPLPAEAADHYGTIRAALARSGSMIGGNDLWIAAHAIASGLTLISNNEREFRRVDGLRFENWAR